MSSTISGKTVNQTVTLGAGAYPEYGSPLTITSTGAIVTDNGHGIFGPSSGSGTIVNLGTVRAGTGAFIDGYDGAHLGGSFHSVTNGDVGATSTLIAGGAGGSYGAGNGPGGLGGAGTNLSGILANHGTIVGGIGGSTPALPAGPAGPVSCCRAASQ